MSPTAAPMADQLGLVRLPTDTAANLDRANVATDPEARREGPGWSWHRTNEGQSVYGFTEGLPEGPLEDTIRFRLPANVPSWLGSNHLSAPAIDHTLFNARAGDRFYVAIRARATGVLRNRTMIVKVALADGSNTQGGSATISMGTAYAWHVVAIEPTGAVAATANHRPVLTCNGDNTTTEPAEVHISAWSVIVGGPFGQGLPPGLTAEDLHFTGSSHAAGSMAWARWTGAPDESASVAAQLDATPPYTKPIKTVRITRGGRPSPTGVTTSVGTAQVTTGAAPPMGWAIGTRYALVHLPTGEHLHTGALIDVDADANLDHSTGQLVNTWTLHLADRHHLLGNTQRYGLVTPGDDPQLTDDRIAQLMASVPELPWRIGQLPEATTWHQSVVYESSVANHLTLTTTGARASWCLDRDDRLVVTSGRTGGAVVPRTSYTQLTDGSATVPSVGNPPEPWPYVGYSASTATAQAVTAAELVNHGRRPNPDSPGEYLADDVRYDHTNHLAAASYGVRVAKLDSCVIPTQAQALAEFYTTGPVPGPGRPRQVRLNAGLHGLPPGIDVLDVITVTRAGVHYRCFVAGITHAITPTSWLVTYTLGDTGQPPV